MRNNKGQFIANGIRKGQVSLTRKHHKELKKAGRHIEFIRTHSHSGKLIRFADDTGVALGCCNINQAGRGYRFRSFSEMVDTVKKFDATLAKAIRNAVGCK